MYMLKSAQIYCVWFLYIGSNERIWQIDSDVKMLIFLWYFSMCVFFLVVRFSWLFVSQLVVLSWSLFIRYIESIFPLKFIIVYAPKHICCVDFLFLVFSDFRMFASYIGAFFVSLYAVVLQNIRKSKDYPIEI